jgi:hypothetical protein
MHLRGFFLHPMRCGHWRNLTNDREEIQYRNYDAAFRTILKISKGFHRSKQNLSIYFLFLFFSSTGQPINFKASGAWT